MYCAPWVSHIGLVFVMCLCHQHVDEHGQLLLYMHPHDDTPWGLYDDKPIVVYYEHTHADNNTTTLIQHEVVLGEFVNNIFSIRMSLIHNII